MGRRAGCLAWQANVFDKRRESAELVFVMLLAEWHEHWINQRLLLGWEGLQNPTGCTNQFIHV